MLQDLHAIQFKKPIVELARISEFKLPQDVQKQLNNILGKDGYGFQTYTSHVITAKATQTKSENIAVIPNQYFIYACEIYDFAIALYKYFEIFEALRSNSSDLLGSAPDISSNITSNPNLSMHFNSPTDIERFAEFLDKNNNHFRFGSKRLINDSGEARGSRDCFGSVILKIINIPDTSSGVFGGLVYDLCKHTDAFNLLLKLKQKKDLNTLVQQKQPQSSTRFSKPFILLAGISGTGKSRFVRKQAEAWPNIENFELVAVRPDWHEPSDLLGYVLRLKNDPEFISTPVLKFMVKAWLAALDNGVQLNSNDSKTVASCQLDNLPPPFWLCLDEMNLAPVEQYFADYLSIIETREWHGDEYRSEPILDAHTIQESSNMKEALGLAKGDTYAEVLWQHIEQYGLAIPFNLMVAGTVNMDETTHGFSRKVVDRALSLDFGEFAPNNFADFFKADDQKPQFKTLTYPTVSHASVEDENAQKTIEFLQALNEILKSTLFEIAYRALNECLIAVECQQPSDEVALQAVWDDFLMMKVLPRIEGDEDKLISPNTKDDNILEALENLLKTQFNEIWDGANRPDLLRDNAGSIQCRSKAKIERMKKLFENGFTSFWP